jgi:hypothetical protein
MSKKSFMFGALFLVSALNFAAAGSITLDSGESIVLGGSTVTCNGFGGGGGGGGFGRGGAGACQVDTDCAAGFSCNSLGRCIVRPVDCTTMPAKTTCSEWMEHGSVWNTECEMVTYIRDCRIVTACGDVTTQWQDNKKQCR